MKNTITRRELLYGLGAVSTLALSCATTHTARVVTRPNILFIMTDDHTVQAMSCYGSRINKTPNLDRIAEGGMLFNNCFCTNSICAPSRACILTGKYSHENGLRTNRDTFDGSQLTFPKVLQQTGYQTALVGKWHLKSDPTGFDYWNILPGQGDYHNPVMIEMGDRKQHEGYVTDLITDFSLDWLEQRDMSRPFCLLCQHKAPHRRWQPDEKHADMYEGIDIPVPETFDDDYMGRGTAAHEAEMRVADHLDPQDLKMDPPESLSAEDLKHWKYQRYIKDYLRCVASVDDNVGRILDYLDKTGLADNTLVVYTSDQGFYLGDHGWFDKRFMYEESLRMPLLMRYPGVIDARTTNDDMVLNIDFGPTFLDVADAPIPEEMQGQSFEPILEGHTPSDWRTSMYYQYYEYPAVHMVNKHYGVRTKGHKLIYFYELDEWELYDLKEDPHELISVYGDPAYSEIQTRMTEELRRLQEQYDVPEEFREKA